MPNGSPIPGGPDASRRRSQRVILSLRVIVRTEDGPKATSFEAETITLVVNAHGALIALSADSDAEARDWATFGIHQGSHDTPEVRARLWQALDDPSQAGPVRHAGKLARAHWPGHRRGRVPCRA